MVLSYLHPRPAAKEEPVTAISRLTLASMVAIGGVIGLVQIVGCGETEDQEAKRIREELRACGLDDGSLGKHDRLHACDPGDTKKTTVCHIPPGNPANAHTICVGNPAASPHQHHHGDTIGAACVNETPCPPPGGGGAGGATGGAGGATGGAGGATGGAGGDTGGAGGATGGSGGGGGLIP
jgi:hypothetical protein